MTGPGDRWMAEPLTRFVDEARVLTALLIDTSGRVLARHGFPRSVDVSSVAALAANVHAASAALGRQLDEPALGPIHHGGAERQLYLAPMAVGDATLVLVTAFDAATSLGLVRLYVRELQQHLARAAPAAGPEPATDAEGFERELQRSLAQLFGRT